MRKSVEMGSVRLPLVDCSTRVELDSGWTAEILPILAK